jgi:hypothetical protein
MRINRTPTVIEFDDLCQSARDSARQSQNENAKEQLKYIGVSLGFFRNEEVTQITLRIVKPEPQIFDLLGLTYEGSQLKEFSFPLLRERYQGQIEDSVMVRVIFIH